jgi:hypothetical protein
MVIIVRFRSKKANGGLSNIHIPESLKFPNDHDFGFDVRVKENWRHFLSTYPKVAADGNKIYRDVYVFGNIQGHKKPMISLYNEYQEEKENNEQQRKDKENRTDRTD